MRGILLGGATALAVATSLLVFTAAGLWWSLQPGAHLAVPEPGALLRDVALVVPGVGRHTQRSLEVRGGHIAEIAEARPTPDDPFAGAFVLPGLVDMHVHWPAAAIPGQAELFALLHLAHGVTTVRTLGDGFDGAAVRLRDAVAEGRLAGPRILSCGPIVDGDPPLWRGSLVVRNADEARALVQRLADAGADCIKAYDELDAESAIALREAAHARGLPIVGHTPRRVAFEVARLDDVQHLRGVHPPFEMVTPRYPFFLAAWRALDEARLEFVIETSLRHGIAHTPTLVTVDRLIGSERYRQMVEAPAYALLPPWYRDGLWDAGVGLNAARLMDTADFAMVRHAFSRMLETVGRLHAAGVPIHSGTDTLAPAVVPGAALHRELELLVEAGLDPEEALEVSTRISARFLGISGLGEIRPGAPAELAIFREDPTRDLAALATLAGVVRGGRLYTRETLDDALAREREHFEGFGQRVVLTGGLRLVLGRLLPLLFAGVGEVEDASAGRDG